MLIMLSFAVSFMLTVPIVEVNVAAGLLRLVLIGCFVLYLLLYVNMFSSTVTASALVAWS